MFIKSHWFLVSINLWHSGRADRILGIKNKDRLRGALKNFMEMLIVKHFNLLKYNIYSC